MKPQQVRVLLIFLLIYRLFIPVLRGLNSYQTYPSPVSMFDLTRLKHVSNIALALLVSLRVSVKICVSLSKSRLK